MAQGANPSSSAAGTASSSKSKGKISLRVGHQSATSTSRSGKAAKPHTATAAADVDNSDNDDQEDELMDKIRNQDLDLEDDVDDFTDGDDDDAEDDTDNEIEASKNAAAGAKSKKTAKRKRRATSPTSFGQALEGLLGAAPASPSDDDAGSIAAAASDDDDDVDYDPAATAKPAKKRKPTSTTSAQPAAILSLAPHLRRSAQSVHLNAKASRIAIEERRAREERARVKDVIGGWGPPGVLPTLNLPATDATALKNDQDDDEKLSEWMLQGGSTGYERRLRKVAQRGVVKLFNAIRAAQTTTKNHLDDAEAAAPVKSGGAKKPNALGGKEARLADLSKNNFLDLIRKGSTPKGARPAAATAAR